MHHIHSFSHTRRRILLAGGIGSLLPDIAWAESVVSRGQDVIVLIPGITGSVLSLHGREVWSPSFGGVTRALLSLGATVDSLRLRSDPVDRQDLQDGVVATRLVEDIHLIPGLWKIDGYSRLINRISSKPGIKPGENFFQFPYDWRRDNRVSAARLQIAAHTWLKDWRMRSGNNDAKLVFLAHSMGGLVAKYFIECMEGWKSTRRLISFGTPYGGSLKALRYLHQGFGTALSQGGLLDLTTLVRSFTSPYQLLPIYPCIEEAGVLKRITETGSIANVDKQRAATALAFHHEIKAAVEANRKLPQYVEASCKTHPIVGVAQQTFQIVSRTGPSLAFLNTFPGQDIDGDGTVPRPSATPIELQGQDKELYVASTHGSLQNSTYVHGQLIALLDAPAESQWKAFRGANTIPMASVQVPDAIAEGDRMVISGKLDLAEYEEQVEIEATEAYSKRRVARVVSAVDARGIFSSELPVMPTGTYRVTVQFTRRQVPDFVSVSDVACVLPLR